ncbi:uncharacterized protein LOC109621606 [Aedes albopictus]|uniref:GPI-GlcNAc transferase complex PIG-H component conserved domain-containing protein n=1 Tax=Aedes albopictus TaxID=7160 RepID=A0ABM1YIY2_AEDAL
MYPPIVRYATIRYLLAVAALLDLDVFQMGAFLQEELDEEVIYNGTARRSYVYNRSEGLSPAKPLYGLKQSSGVWNRKLDAELKDIGLKRSSFDPCGRRADYHYCSVLWFHGAFVILLGLIAFSYTRIVRNESLVLVKDFALQYSTNFIGGSTKNVLIPIKHIHDVVINEAFHNLKVVFILTVLTKGNLFKSRPAITLLNHLNPRVDCLEMIYNEVHTILDIEND